MKKYYISVIAAALAAMVSLASCEKIDSPSEEASTVSENIAAPSLTGARPGFAFKSVNFDPDSIASRGYKYLTGIADTSYYNTADELYTRAMNSISGTLEDLEISDETFRTIADVVYSQDIYSLATRMFIHSGNGAKGRFEEYVFRYASTSSTGEPITLTGVAVFPNYQTDGIFRHTIDNLTLLHDHLKAHDDEVSEDGTLEYLRAIYNNVVVVSDYEGYNEAYGVHPYVSYNELARQSIDCGLAALELMDYVGLNMRCGYQVYNMGMSKGGGVAIAAQKMLENTESAEVRAKLPIAGTYSASGLYDFKSMMEYFNDKKLAGTSTEDEDLQIAWVEATAIYFAYTTHKKSVFSDNELKDFFTDDFYATALEQKIFGNPTVGWGTVSKVFKNTGMNTLEKVLNPRFFIQDGEDKGKINGEDELVKKVFAVFDEENPTLGWTPKKPLLMEHSYDDQLSCYDTSYENYLQLKYHTPLGNANVNLNTYYDLDHNTMSGLAMVRMTALKEPHECIIYNIFQ